MPHRWPSARRHERVQAAARAGARRPRAARALAAAAAAALAGRATRERVRDRRGQRRGAGGHRPVRARRACASSSARSTRPACGSSTCACWCAPTRTRTTTGWPAPIVEAAGLRAVDAPQPPPHDAGRRRIPSAPSSGASRWPARAACRLDALARYQAEREGQGFGDRGDRPARPRPAARASRWTPTWALRGVRDARARAVARGAPPARARPAPVRATTCSAACRSSTTTAGRRTPPASSCGASTWSAASTCS